MTEYTYKRLCFKKKEIEKLEAEQPFRVVTPDNTFQFTRTQFETVFAGILLTMSWQVHGIYHFPKVPKRALPFRVTK